MLPTPLVFSKQTLICVPIQFMFTNTYSLSANKLSFLPKQKSPFARDLTCCMFNQHNKHHHMFKHLSCLQNKRSLLAPQLKFGQTSHICCRQALISATTTLLFANNKRSFLEQQLIVCLFCCCCICFGVCCVAVFVWCFVCDPINTQQCVLGCVIFFICCCCCCLCCCCRVFILYRS